MKSNLPRSAVWAKRANESNSMWLPAAGSLHTVVLFTPGKCAARWICFVKAGVLRFGAQAAWSDGGVPVSRAGQAQQLPQRGWPRAGGRVGRAERRAALQFRHEGAGDLGQV